MGDLDLSVTCHLHKTTEMKTKDVFQSLERTKEEANAARSQSAWRENCGRRNMQLTRSRKHGDTTAASADIVGEG